MSPNRGHYKTALLSGLSMAELCARPLLKSLKPFIQEHWNSVSVEGPAVENSAFS